MGGVLDNYLKRFAKLRTDRSNAWGPETRGQAPHKAFLLLAVIDSFAIGDITGNLVALTPELGALFDGYWGLVQPMGRERGKVATPYFHLRSEGFWHLLPRAGQENYVRQEGSIQSVSKLQKMVRGARLDEALFVALCTERGREALRRVLVDTYFEAGLRSPLLAQGVLNAQAERYAQRLLRLAGSAMRDEAAEYGVDAAAEEEEPLTRRVRDQGFRRAVVQAYDHRCALCGVRIRTPDGRSAIVAAHIVPWSESHNDDPRNGMALCQLCHWTFDEGLFGVSQEYVIHLSRELSAAENMPGHLHTLGDRLLIGPQEEKLWPLRESLRWHWRHTFRR